MSAHSIKFSKSCHIISNRRHSVLTEILAVSFVFFAVHQFNSVLTDCDGLPADGQLDHHTSVVRIHPFYLQSMFNPDISSMQVKG